MKRKWGKNMNGNKHTEKGESVCKMIGSVYFSIADILVDKWIQCLTCLCLEWAHVYCSNGDDMFRCENCRVGWPINILLYA